MTSNEKARQAIVAQIERNENHIQLVKKKKDLLIQKLENRIRQFNLIEAQQQNRAAALSMKGNESSSQDEDVGLRIVRVMDEQDSLLQVLIGRKDVSESQSSSTTTLSGSTASYKLACKVPKNDKTIIEELRTSNEQLRILVEQLVSELECLRKENEMLNAELESMRRDQMSNRDSSSLPHLPPLEQPKILY